MAKLSEFHNAIYQEMLAAVLDAVCEVQMTPVERTMLLAAVAPTLKRAVRAVKEPPVT